MSLIKKLLFYPQSLWLRQQIAATRRLLKGRFRWQAYEALEIPGFGDDLIRVDFPPAQGAVPRWGYGQLPSLPELSASFAANVGSQLDLLRTCLAYSDSCRAWPDHENLAQTTLPWRKNQFFYPFDMATLYGMLRHLQPSHYVEIGSGMSTRIAWQARHDGGFPMPIISIDPAPRLDIAALCDQVYRQRLEDLPDALSLMQLPHPVVFFDGSHRCLPASDVTIFFLEILPRLRSGTIVHIHDIFLPADYPPAAFGRYWSEQYLLAAYLLGGAKGLEVMLPGAYLSTHSDARPLIAAALGQESAAAGGSSFWLRKTSPPLC